MVVHDIKVKSQFLKKIDESKFFEHFQSVPEFFSNQGVEQAPSDFWEGFEFAKSMLAKIEKSKSN